MKQIPEPPETDPSLAEIVLKGFLYIVFVFIVAVVIVSAHYPSPY